VLWSPDAGVLMRCRAGIATGLVIIGDFAGAGEFRDREIVGDTPEFAVRLRASAEPDTVAIDSATRRLMIGNLFEFRELGTLKITGSTEPVQSCRCWERVWSRAGSRLCADRC
jgi:class 3 adenylate cyclase